MNDNSFLYQLIVTIGLLIPIATLIWKAAKQSGKLETIESRVTKLEENYKNDVNEIKEAIVNLQGALIKIETSLSYIEKSITKKGNE